MKTYSIPKTERVRVWTESSMLDGTSPVVPLPPHPAPARGNGELF